MKKKIIAIGLILSLMATPILSGCTDSSAPIESSNSSATESTELYTVSDNPYINDEFKREYFTECSKLPTPDSAIAGMMSGSYFNNPDPEHTTIYSYRTISSFEESCEVYIELLRSLDFRLKEGTTSIENREEYIIIYDNVVLGSLIIDYNDTDYAYLAICLTNETN